MKKLSLYIAALLSMGLMACNQDFETVFNPQTNLPESQLQTSDVSVSNSAISAISIADYIDADGLETPIPIGTVTVKEGAMPANTILRAEVEFSRDADFANSIFIGANSLEGSNEISVQPGTLQDAYFNDITHNPNTTDVYMRTILYTVTDGTSEAIIGKPGENYYTERTLSFTPLFKVQISPAYYVIGAAGGWSAEGARTQKFSHSEADVYDDPVFSIIVDAGGDDCWFAIGDDAALDAVDAGDWTQLLGVKGESEDLTGNMDFRYNLGGDHSFHVTGAKKIRITLDMMEYKYTIEPVNIAESYYLIGGPGEWNAESAMTMPFSHSSKDVFDDPVFTYVFEGNGGTGDIWFAFGDADAIEAVAAGDWSNLFGTKGESTDLTGSFDYRYNLDGDHSFCIDGAAKQYRVTINAAEMTYEIKALDFAEYIWQAGNANGWGSPAAPLYAPNGDGQYTGFMYLDGEFKFRSGEDNWDAPDWGIGAGGEGTLAEQAGNLSATTGYYQVNVDLAGMTYSLTPITTMGIVGPAQAGGWDADTDMTFNTESGAWEATIELAADELKFRANDGWDINWGGTTDNLTQGGANLKIDEAGTYFIQLFAYCDSKAYCIITKQ